MSSAPSVFDFQDYKEFIRAQIEFNRLTRGYRAALAQAAGCQRTYLSQALHGSVELTPDHAIGLAELWNLNEDETEFFLELLGLSRAGTARLKSHVASRLKTLRKKREDLSARLKEPQLSDAHHELLYYSSWIWTTLHAVVGIPALQTAPKIAEYLELPVRLVEAHLSALRDMGLVRLEGGRWRVARAGLHLPKDSPNVWIHHQNWRGLALEDAKEPRRDSFHYTALHTLSRKDAAKLGRMFRDFVMETRRVVEPSPEEELVCLCMDYFRLGK